MRGNEVKQMVVRSTKEKKKSAHKIQPTSKLIANDERAGHAENASGKDRFVDGPESCASRSLVFSWLSK
jgi:hypothetical protein